MKQLSASGMQRGSDMELTTGAKIVLFVVGVSFGGCGLFICFAAIELFKLVVTGKYS